MEDNDHSLQFHQLNQKLKDEIEYAKYTGQHVAVLYLITHKKNEILRDEQINFLKKFENKNVSLYEINQNQFCYLLSRINNKDEVGRFSQLILKESHDVCQINIGIAVFPMGGMSVSRLIQHSKTAAMQALKDKKSSYYFYRPDVQKSIDRILLIESELPFAIARDELILHYQPQVCLKTNELISVEALVRWNHPKLGLVSPGEFIPIAESTDAIFDLGEWVIREACKEYKTLPLKKPIYLAINLSPKQLASYYIVDRILSLLKEINFTFSCLELEVTENQFIADFDTHVKKLKMLAKNDISIAIDDFGSGYSNLQYLKKLPIKKLKIDMSFIQKILVDNTDKIIVQSTIEIAHQLGLRVVAEGIETVDQLNALIEMGCDDGQGYLFSKPLPLNELNDYLNS